MIAPVASQSAPTETSASPLALNCLVVVEDEPAVAGYLQGTLQSMGFRVPAPAMNCEQALDRIRDHRPALALIDIHLAGERDGIETARLIRERFATPVIFMTGLSDRETLDRARKEEPYGFLLKPFEDQELFSAISVALSRSREQRKLESSREEFSSTLRSLSDAVIATNLVGNITFLNPLAAELTGWEARDAIGRPIRDVFRVSMENGDEVKMMPERDKGGTWRQRELFLTTREGEMLPIEDTTAPVRADDGSLSGLVVVFRKRSIDPDRELHAEERSRLLGVVDGIADPLIAVDANWKVTFVNRLAADFFSKEVEQMLGLDLWGALPAGLHERHYNEFYRAMKDRKASTFSTHSPEINQWMEVNAYPFSDGLLLLLKDVTERREQELKLQRKDKLESLGLLARGFAHDFNNLLTVLIGNLSLAQAKVLPGHDGREELDAAKKATMQAQNRVQQLMTFAKGGAPVKSVQMVGKILRDWLDHRESAPGVEIDLVVQDGLWNAELDRDQFFRLMDNLLQNAEQSLVTEAGKIEIRVGNAPEAQALRRRFPQGLNLEDGIDYIVIRVTDNGPGIAEENIHRVIEPYFSTRRDQNATGLGLTVCDSIVRSHGGGLGVESQVGKGTSVTVAFPAIAASEQSPNPKAEPSPPQPKPETTPAPSPSPSQPKKILILEDEDLIRRLMRLHLEGARYEVTETTEGSQTVEKFREAETNETPFDLVICDLTIANGMGGLKTMQEIRNIRSTVKSIVSSGYSDDPAMADPKKFGFDAVLPKPYQPEALVKLVQETIAS